MIFKKTILAISCSFVLAACGGGGGDSSGGTAAQPKTRRMAALFSSRKMIWQMQRILSSH